MSNELATVQPHGLTISTEQDWWTPRQEAALAQLGIAEAPKADQAVFLHQCQRTGLDPFARQIYMIGRWSKNGTKYTIQTSIDGFRLIGRRAADAGRETLEVTDTQWCGADGVWRDVWLADEPPAAARVAVIRNGGRFPAVALFKEYAGTTKSGDLTQMWREKGALTIAKCAEALAWRKAFPQDLSGLYTGDEMQQADRASRATPAPQPEPEPDADGVTGITPDQSRRIGDLMGQLSLGKSAMLDIAEQIAGRPIGASTDLSEIEAEQVIAMLDAQTAIETVDAEVVG